MVDLLAVGRMMQSEELHTRVHAACSLTGKRVSEGILAAVAKAICESEDNSVTDPELLALVEAYEEPASPPAE